MAATEAAATTSEACKLVAPLSICTAFSASAILTDELSLYVRTRACLHSQMNVRE